MDDDDELDLCEISFVDYAVDDETAELLPLFPDGVQDEAKAAEWRALAEAAAESWLPPEARYGD